MKNILAHKPKLAICIYHKFDDLWNIPLFLKHWLPGYKLVMRHYECTQDETVIYFCLNSPHALVWFFGRYTDRAWRFSPSF